MYTVICTQRHGVSCTQVWRSRLTLLPRSVIVESSSSYVINLSILIDSSTFPSSTFCCKSTKDDSFESGWGLYISPILSHPQLKISRIWSFVIRFNLVSQIWIIVGFGVKFWSCGKMGFGVKSRGKISRDLSTKPPSVITNWIHLWSCLAATVILLPIYLDNFYSFCNHQTPQTQHWL